MSQSLEHITTQALGWALDAASLRQQAIASNIANHATPGYTRRSVDFGAQLADAVRQLRDGDRLEPRGSAGARPSMQPALDASGHATSVRLDQEMADLAQNAVHFQALARALSRHLAILHMAAADGKR